MAPLEQRICRQRNHEAPDSGIPKRKKTETRPRLSCKIEYWLRSNHSDKSIASEYFTGDSIGQARFSNGTASLRRHCGAANDRIKTSKVRDFELAFSLIPEIVYCSARSTALRLPIF